MMKQNVLLPDDKPEDFYYKIRLTPMESLESRLRNFERYEQYYHILRFSLEAKRRPGANVSVVFNDSSGWHLSCCLRSVPMLQVDDVDCTCAEDIRDPDNFFRKLESENQHRCKLCKLYAPVWEVVEIERDK